jgi:hypothetical protein
MLKSAIAAYGLRIAMAAMAIGIAAAQEAPSPSSSAIPEESPSPLVSPEASATPSAPPEQTPVPSPARSARISFVPPPLEGTISLGIYDKTGKLVRILHQEAELTEFTIGADALVTQWDGKDDDGRDLPAGKYHARGYAVGPLKVQQLGDASSSQTQNAANTKLKVRLVRNPLRKEKRPVVDLGVGFDEDASYLETSDELPLLSISDLPNLARVWMTKKGEEAVDVWQDDGTKVHQSRISNIDQMMAFDCGEFELK